MNAAATAQWPPSLKKFVTDAFSQTTEANKAVVETELKKLIFDAYESNSVWSTDWESIQLQSLKPPKRKASSITSSPFRHPDPIVELDRREKRMRRFPGGTQGAGVLAGGSLVERMGSTNLSTAGYGNGTGYGNGFDSGRATPELVEAIYDPNVIDWDKHTIVGTSKNLEKRYLRLTSVPDPSTIRPLHVLKQTLEMLKKRWRADQNYNYICDQFKSLRQDVTVQRIKNDFTVSVYEIHGRIALEKGDLGEYNQCQSQLRELYKHGLGGHPFEFLSYRILYLLFARNFSEINSLLSKLTDEERGDEGVQHALEVRRALATSNYCRLFRLYNTAPRMGAYMMDHLVARERVSALVVMTKSYKSIPLSFIADQLGFDTSSDAHDFLLTRSAAEYLPLDSTAERPMQVDGDGQLSPDDLKQVDCKLAHPKLVASMKTFTKVDIKGQL